MTVYASSNFNGTSGNLLSTFDSTWSRNAAAGNDWFISDAGRARCGGTNAIWYYNVSPPSADYKVKATIHIVGAGVAANAPGVTGRNVTGVATYYEARLAFSSGSSANWQLYRRVAGTYTQLGSNVGMTFSTGQSYALELRMAGDQISLYVDGVLTIGPITDANITATGIGGIRDNAAVSNSAGFHIDDWSVESLAGDTTAPVLTSPTGTATGSTTATVGATTDEGNGTLYAFVSTSATPPAAATLKAGTGAAWAGSQAVSSTGAKTLNATGLTASTGYYAHLIHTDAAANDSNIVSSALFTTSAPASPPTITDQPDNATVKRGQTATFTITASGATSYQWERDTGSGYADISGATSASYTTPATTMADNADLYRCKTTNADGTTTSSAATLTVQQCVLALNAAGYEFGDGNSPTTMAVLASTELQVAAYPLTEWPPASPVATATATTSAAGRLADLGDDDLIFGTTYRVIARNAANGETWAWTMDAT